jgi:ABC-type transporter Mla MlaB component
VLRILSSGSDSAATIRLEGKLLQAWVPEVRNAVASARLRGIPRVDLRGVLFVDQEGMELLHELAGSGVVLDGASPFITELLANAVRRVR